MNNSPRFKKFRRCRKRNRNGITKRYSDGVIKSLAEFVRLPSFSTYVKTAVAMQRDLWEKKTSIDENILEVIRKDRST